MQVVERPTTVAEWDELFFADLLRGADLFTPCSVARAYNSISQTTNVIITLDGVAPLWIAFEERGPLLIIPHCSTCDAALLMLTDSALDIWNQSFPIVFCGQCSSPHRELAARRYVFPEMEADEEASYAITAAQSAYREHRSLMGSLLAPHSPSVLDLAVKVEVALLQLGLIRENWNCLFDDHVLLSQRMSLGGVLP